MPHSRSAHPVVEPLSAAVYQMLARRRSAGEPGPSDPAPPALRLVGPDGGAEGERDPYPHVTTAPGMSDDTIQLIATWRVGALTRRARFELPVEDITPTALARAERYAVRRERPGVRLIR